MGSNAGEIKANSSKNYLTVKQYAEQFGVSPSLILSIVKEFGVDPIRDENDRLVFEFEDIQDAFIEHEEKNRRKNLEHDTELFRRILPELNRNVSETLKKEMVLAIAIKDEKEAKLIEQLGLLRQVLVELRTTATFLTKMTAQINLAAAAGLNATLPKMMGDEPISPIEDPSKRSENEKQPKQKISSFIAEGYDGEVSELLKTMLKSKKPYLNGKKDSIVQNIDYLENYINLSSEELKESAVSEKSQIEKVLRSWEEDISDVPKFNSFLSSLTTIKEWCHLKINTVPAVILFLSLNRAVPGTVEASNFMYITGIDEII